MELTGRNEGKVSQGPFPRLATVERERLSTVMTNEALLEIHRALLENDPVAPRRLYETCCKPLSHLLRRQYPNADEDHIVDAVVDALLCLIANPGQYNPARGSLLSFLIHIGKRRLVDRIRKSYTHIKMTAALVEEARLGANNTCEDAEWRRLERDSDATARVQAFLEEALPDPRDRQLWTMQAEGRVATDEAARILAVEHLSLPEQRHICKQGLDRVKKAVSRLFWRKLLPDAKDRALWTIAQRYGDGPPMAECARILGVQNEPECEQARIVRSRIGAVKATVSERLQEIWRYL